MCVLTFCSELRRFLFMCSLFLSLLVLSVFLVMIQCDTIPICLDGDCKIQTTKQIHESVALALESACQTCQPPRIFQSQSHKLAGRCLPN